MAQPLIILNRWIRILILLKYIGSKMIGERKPIQGKLQCTNIGIYVSAVILKHVKIVVDGREDVLSLHRMCKVGIYFDSVSKLIRSGLVSSTQQAQQRP